jgi:uncharacterized protein (TIGR00251 family)
MAWISDTTEGCVIAVHAVPRAAQTHIQGTHGDALKIRIKAPPVDGKANKELLNFIANELGIPLRQLSLLTGDVGRHKRILIRGMSANQASEALNI